MGEKIEKVLKILDDVKNDVKHSSEVRKHNKELGNEHNLMGYYERPKDPKIQGTGLSTENSQKFFFL